MQDVFHVAGVLFSCVDEAALEAALKAKSIGGALSDLFAYASQPVCYRCSAGRV